MLEGWQAGSDGVIVTILGRPARDHYRRAHILNNGIYLNAFAMDFWTEKQLDDLWTRRRLDVTVVCYLSTLLMPLLISIFLY